MMFDGSPVRSAALWVSLGVLAGAGITLGVILVGGVSVADEAGSPFGISVVSVTPGPISPMDVAPTGIPTHSSDDGDDDATVVPAPTPTEVELGDDNGGDSDSGSNSGSGSSGSGGSGSDDPDDSSD